MAEARREVTKSDGQERHRQHRERQNATLYRTLPGNYPHLPRVTGERAAKSAAVAASTLRRTVTGGHSAARVGEPCGRVHESIRGNHSWSRSQCLAFYS